MKRLVLTTLACLVVLYPFSQAPSIVKAVGSSITEPKSKDQEGWKNNEWNGKFFYQGTGSGVKLCVTDGTSAGTVFVADLGTSQTMLRTIPAKDFLYIITSRTVSFSPFTIENQIWKSDGTVAGTSLVFATAPAPVSVTNVFTSDRDVQKNFSVSSNTMYFGGYDATNGNELWVTDGTTAGTHIVLDIKPGIGNSSPQAFCKIGTDVFFTATAVGSERKLWKTDGTAGGTVQIPVAEPFYILDNAVGIVNNKMIFYAHNTVDGYEPYVSDGTAAGTFMLANINPTGNSWLTTSQNAHLRFNNHHCFFVASNGTATALWRTDGTSAGTIQLTTNAQGALSGVSGGSYTETDENGIWMIEYNSLGSGNNEKLYRSNGTPEGTYLVTSGLSYAQNVKSYNGALWMQSRNTGSPANVEPWRSGGNAATTNKAFEIEPGNSGSPTFTPMSSSPYGFFVKNGKLYFFASTTIPSAHNLYEYTGDFTFNGSQTGGLWKDSANWNGRMPPAITDTAYVNSGTPYALSINGGTAYAGALWLGNNAVVNLANTGDSLLVKNELKTGAANSFTGSGVLAIGDNNPSISANLKGGFTANNLATLGHAALQTGDILINENIHLTNNSWLTLNTGNVTLAGSSSTVSQSGNSYFNTNSTGRLFIENLGSTGRTGAIVFPVGNATSYNPATLTNTGTADKFGVRVQPQAFGNYTGESGSGAVYQSGAVNATWFITEAAAGGSNATIQLQWNEAQELPGFNRNATILAHYTAGSWNFGSSSAAAGTNPYQYSRTGITSFSPFAILNNNAVLPVRFLYFSAQKCGANICLSWKTTTEQNVSHFEVQKSLDGRIYNSLKKQSALHHDVNFYTWADEATNSSNGKMYYRIKQIDRDGKASYSSVVALSPDTKGVDIYPTVFHQTFTVQNYTNQTVQLTVYNASGNKLLQQQIIHGTNEIKLESAAGGIYYYYVSDNHGLLQQGKLLKQ